MKTYGHRRRDDLTCKWGCCVGTKTAKKYSLRRGKPRHRETDHAAKSRARREGKVEAWLGTTI